MEDERSSSPGTAHRQARVDRYFDSESMTWRDLYEERTVFGLIHQERQVRALNSIDGLGLPAGTQVLEIGCGAGLTSAALAERGLDVSAIDSAPAMVEMATQLAKDRNLDDRIRASVADAHKLPFSDASFSVVIALGVLPWLHTPDQALVEMARVVRPGGHVLANVDNLLRLHYLLDPLLNPAFGALRRRLGRVFRKVGVLGSSAPIPVHLRSTLSFDSSLSRAGLERVTSATHGFGPFTFWRRPVFSDAQGMRLHHALQSASDQDRPILRSTGAQYLVLATKPDGGHRPSRHATIPR